jgi:SAM-dependent methyltransferase
MNKDYVTVVYNEKDRPLTDYPKRLAGYLFRRYGFKAGDKLLEVGYGRGEFLRGFMDCGVEGYGVDQCSSFDNYCPGAKLKTLNIEEEGIPFGDEVFDVVFSKSVIEHFHYPEKMIKEIYRVLKPGGMIVTLCPSWEFNYRIYYEDYTHRTPFMLPSLRDIHLMYGFENVSVEYFRQLPMLWGRESYLMPLSELTRILIPRKFGRYSKWVRFSKEIMLLSSGVKPKG